MPDKIIVAYSTRLSDESLLPDVNDLTPPGNYKSESAISKWREGMAESVREEALRQPYTATFEEVRIVDPLNDRSNTFKFREADDPRPPVAIAVRDWLLSYYPDVWPNSPVSRGYPEAIFVGFDPKLFLRILGIECSLPSNQPDPTLADGESVVLPLSLWYGNSDHRDIENAVKPQEYKALTWKTVLAARGLTELAGDWNGPGDDVEKDLLLSLEMAGQLGFLSEEEQPVVHSG